MSNFSLYSSVYYGVERVASGALYLGAACWEASRTIVQEVLENKTLTMISSVALSVIGLAGLYHATRAEFPSRDPENGSLEEDSSLTRPLITSETSEESVGVPTVGFMKLLGSLFKPPITPQNGVLGGIVNPGCNCFMNATLQVLLDSEDDYTLIQQMLVSIEKGEYKGLKPLENVPGISSNLKQVTVAQITNYLSSVLTKLHRKESVGNKDMRLFRLYAVLICSYDRLQSAAPLINKEIVGNNCKIVVAGDLSSDHGVQEDSEGFFSQFTNGLQELCADEELNHTFNKRMTFLRKTKCSDGDVFELRVRLLTIPAEKGQFELEEGIRRLSEHDFKTGEVKLNSQETLEKCPEKCWLSMKLFNDNLEKLPAIRGYAFGFEENFNIFISTEQEKSIKYKLSSFLVHRGQSLRAGHYIAYKKEVGTDGQERWFCYDDHLVSYRADDDVKRLFDGSDSYSTPYMLKFRRID